MCLSVQGPRKFVFGGLYIGGFSLIVIGTTGYIPFLKLVELQCIMKSTKVHAELYGLPINADKIPPMQKQFPSI